MFKAAAKMGKYMEAGATTHKSWTPHIAMYIVPRHVARYGDLWRFSSAWSLGATRLAAEKDRVMRGVLSPASQG